MSTAASSEYPVDAAHVAQETDRRFLHIARLLPFEHKTAPTFQVNHLHRLEGVGTLTSEYLGRHKRNPSDIGDLLIRVTAVFDGHDGKMGFFHDFVLTYGRDGGVPRLGRETPAEEFADCPFDLAQFAGSLAALHEDFVKTYAAAHAEQGATSLVDRISF